MRFVRFVRNVTLSVWNHDEEEGDLEAVRKFHRGSRFAVGEVSPVREGGFTVIEFCNLGFAEVPDDAWVWDDYPCVWRKLARRTEGGPRRAGAKRSGSGVVPSQALGFQAR